MRVGFKFIKRSCSRFNTFSSCSFAVECKFFFSFPLHFLSLGWFFFIIFLSLSFSSFFLFRRRYHNDELLFLKDTKNTQPQKPHHLLFQAGNVTIISTDRISIDFYKLCMCVHGVLCTREIQTGRRAYTSKRQSSEKKTLLVIKRKQRWKRRRRRRWGRWWWWWWTRKDTWEFSSLGSICTYLGWLLREIGVFFSFSIKTLMPIKI